MGESRRDEGLVRAVGPWGLAASIVNMVVGAGIFAVPAALAASIGPYAPIAFVVCAIAIGSIAICFAEGGSRVPTSGGAYGYVEVAFGPLVAYATGTLLWFSDLLACGGVAAALADVVSSLFAPEWRAAVRVAVVVSAVGTIAMINIGGVARGARFISIATVVKLIPLAIFIVVGATAINGSNFAVPTQVDTSGIGRALILALFTFTGMEVSLCASGEVARPARTIPRALLIAMLSVTLLYVAIQVVAQGVLGPALAKSTVPLADAMGQISPALRLLLLAGAAVSMLGWLGSDILGTPRILFAFARDGLMPRALGRVHPRSHAPHVAIICYAILAIVLALSGTFAELAVLSTLTVTVPYVAGCAAAWRLARRGVALAGEPLGFRWLGAAAAVGIISSFALVALASPDEILGFAAAVAIAVAIYVIQTRLVPART
ncbi:MAG TPA: amino acid permease [Rhodanobacteraceae bacterium]|jgi:amino acid transporter|nr:amino acid permease [Rhodanobacteraceae bacterium]